MTISVGIFGPLLFTTASIVKNTIRPDVCIVILTMKKQATPEWLYYSIGMTVVIGHW